MRLAAKLSQHALAVAADTTPTTVSRWERSVSEPSLAHLRRVADALGVTLAALVEEGST